MRLTLKEINSKLVNPVTAAEIRALRDPKVRARFNELGRAAMVDLGPTNAVELVHNSR